MNTWDPQAYEEFKNERYAPFEDAVKLIEGKAFNSIIDLGCGTGELTSRLAGLYPGAQVTGIDNSAEMLAKAESFAKPNLSFRQQSIEDFLQTDEKYDLVFSNSSLQWIENHEDLLPGLFRKVNGGGTFLAQMPDQPQNIANKIILEIAGSAPFNGWLQGYSRPYPGLGLSRYSEILFRNGGKNIKSMEIVYPVITDDPEGVMAFTSSTTLLPYKSRLSKENYEEFSAEYLKRLSAHFTECPVFYPFKRIILKADFQ